MSPERLLPLVRDSLPHPFLKLLSPVDGQDAASLAAKLESVFNSLREVWRGEKDAIRSHFGSGAKWANKPYNDDELMAEAFRQVELAWAPRSFPRPRWTPWRPSEALPSRKGSKKAKLPAPKHRFFDLCDELARAAEHYMIGVKLEALRYVEQELPRRKDELKIQFFDDLLRRVHEALAGERRRGAGHGAAPAIPGGAD